MLPLLFSVAQAAGGEAAHPAAVLSPLWVLPFAGMLLCIALGPILAPHFWEKPRHQLMVAGGWSLPVLLWLGARHSGGDAHAAHELGHTAMEYLSFLCLLGSLFVISGGVALRGDLRATPLTNTGFMALGALLANLIGTTGASMLLIRPLLSTNSERQNRAHIPIFFIFIVSNIGGALTPIGDPPLFLGYLRGVPFAWPLQQLWPLWLMAIALLLVVFYLLDKRSWSRESDAARAWDEARVQPLHLWGGRNVALLLGVVGCVLLLSPGADPDDLRRLPLREAAMVGLAVLSLWWTAAPIRNANRFTWGPIQEVAALFAGIFITMIPAMALLSAHGPTLGVEAPWQFFWAAGSLSSFLDNAPTYISFATVACTQVAACADPQQLGTLASDPQGTALLRAIAAGSVFMGANTYIGNGPNFMVRAISEEAGHRMPGFFGYMMWSGCVLLPLFAVLTLIFFR